MVLVSQRHRGRRRGRCAYRRPSLVQSLQFRAHQPHAGEALLPILLQHAVDQVDQPVRQAGDESGQVGAGWVRMAVSAAVRLSPGKGRGR